MGFLNLFRKEKLTADAKENLTAVLDIINNLSFSMYQIYSSLQGNKIDINNINDKTFLEIFFFILWEFDLALFLTKQSHKVRKLAITAYLKDISDIFKSTTDLNEIKNVSSKRLVEYGTIIRDEQNKIGSPTDLLTNYFIYNLDYSLNNNSFYMCKASTRPIYIMDIDNAISYGNYVLKYHLRIRNYFMNILKHNKDFTKIAKSDFTKILIDAHEKDILFQKELTETS